MNTSRILRVGLAAMLVAASAALAAKPAVGTPAPTPAPPLDVAAKVRALTGAETRIVWLRHTQWESFKGGLDGGAGYALMALDTSGKGERELVPAGECYNPLIAPSGRRVLYTARTDGKLQIHCVDWDGANSRSLGEGFALWTWRDPETKLEWVYASNAGGNDGAFIDRFPLDTPERRERIYTGRLANRLSLSADGTRAVGEFPHPLAGMLYTRTGEVDRKDYRTGCNSYIAPDNSYFVTIMAGGHDLVTLYKPDGSSRDVSVIPPGLKPLKRGGRGCMWNPKWASDARHLVVAGPFKQLGPDHADIWLGQFADDFSAIAQWVQVTDNAYMDVYAFVWIDPGLGQYEDEAPYTLAVPPAVVGPGNWAWDFGDGTKATDGTHTYRTPGRYLITATQGDRVLRGRVVVQPRMPPQVMAVRLFDDEQVQVQFDKCIRIDQATVSCKSGVAIGRAALDGVGTRLNLTLAGPLPEADTLRVQGIRDLAQEPNILTGEFPIARPDWPAVRRGLVFLWEGHRKQSFTWNPQSRAFHDNTVTPWSQARFNRQGAMVLDGGTYSVTDGGSGIYSQCRQTGQLTVECVLTPFNLYQGSPAQPAVAFGCGRPGDPNIALAQEGNRLLLLLRLRHEGKTEVRRVELTTLEEHHPHHVLVSIADNALTCYVNGAVAKQAELTGAFAWNAPDWSQGLYMGGLPGNPYPWCGQLEGIAAYSRALDAVQAARHFAVYAKRLAARPMAKQIQVSATLAAKTRLPTAAEIAPYRDALVVNEYDVVRVTQGQYALPTVRVVQWGLLDTKPTWVAGAVVGQTYDLVLEAFGDHPQLENEMIIDTLDEDFALDLFVDVTHRPSGPPRPSRLTVHPRELWMPPNWQQQFRVEMVDQYGHPIQAPVTWAVKPGGQLSGGVAYNAVQSFAARDQAGRGTITADGLFTSGATGGVVTILAAVPGLPEAVGKATVGINWPAIHAATEQPLRFGMDQGLSDRWRFTGDIDRIRLYNRALSAEEIAAHAAGTPGTAPGLVGDWPFDDPPKDGAFPNLAGPGLAAQLHHFNPQKRPEQLREGDRGFVRLDGQGYLEVAPDPRLDMTKHCTIEAWVRNANGMIACKQAVWMWGFVFMVHPSGLVTDALRVGGANALNGAYAFAKDTWTHVAVVFDVNGHWQLYANGTRVGEKQPGVLLIYP
jgi:hypothetical protein